MNIDKEKLLAGDRRTLSKAITLIESKSDGDQSDAQSLLNSVLSATGKARRIGISGVPGVGKSTFIEAYGNFLTKKGHQVAVLSVDPSSPLSGGSLMGDKTRMEHLSRNEKAFIRPSPSDGSLGGVANKTREAMLLCEAAGFDIILIETVGVGQSEYEVATMVDLFLVLMLPNAGDELQGIKKGILELAHVIIVNKADLGKEREVEIACSHYQSALSIVSHEGPWTPVVLSCSSLEKRGIEQIDQCLNQYFLRCECDGYLLNKRQAQNLAWFEKLVQGLFWNQLRKSHKFLEVKKLIEQQGVTPFGGATQVLEDLFPT